MSGERIVPGGSGLVQAFYDLGSDGWKAGMDTNLSVLALMCQLKVLDQIDSADIPGAPTNGDIYIINDGADANKIYARDNGAWVEYAPWAGVS